MSISARAQATPAEASSTGPDTSAGGAARERVQATGTPVWQRSPTLLTGGVIALVIAAAGVVLARPDVALLALPLLVAAVSGVAHAQAASGDATASITLNPPEHTRVEFTFALDAPAGVEAAALRYRLLAGDQQIVVLRVPGARLAGTVPLLHSGPQELVRVDYRLLWSAAAAVGEAEDPIVASAVVAPSRRTLGFLPLPRRLQGLTGTHQSARPGDGGDFRDVHPFAPGDRLRRIDWKTTARRGQGPADLYVRRTSALADATILIVLDSGDDVGEQVMQWRRNTAAEKGLSSLDIAREAARAIAGEYIDAGDRVGFQDLSQRERMVPHAGGRRHLWRLLRTIETAQPSSGALTRTRPPIVPPGALIYLLSSLLDDQALTLALRWRGDGHRVIAVDVLPEPRFRGARRGERLAYRIVMMERSDRLHALSSHGVELLRWQEDASRSSRDARLRVLSRAALRPGAGGRR